MKTKFWLVVIVMAVRLAGAQTNSLDVQFKSVCEREDHVRHHWDSVTVDGFYMSEHSFRRWNELKAEFSQTNISDTHKAAILREMMAIIPEADVQDGSVFVSQDGKHKLKMYFESELETNRAISFDLYFTNSSGIRLLQNWPKFPYTNETVEEYNLVSNTFLVIVLDGVSSRWEHTRQPMGSFKVKTVEVVTAATNTTKSIVRHE